MTKKPLKVIAGAPDRPLIIGEISIPCYVLEDETRVLTQDGCMKAIGRTGNPRTDVVKPPAVENQQIRCLASLQSNRDGLWPTTHGGAVLCDYLNTGGLLEYWPEDVEGGRETTRGDYFDLLEFC